MMNNNIWWQNVEIIARQDCGCNSFNLWIWKEKEAYNDNVDFVDLVENIVTTLSSVILVNTNQSLSHRLWIVSENDQDTVMEYRQ